MRRQGESTGRIVASPHPVNFWIDPKKKWVGELSDHRLGSKERIIGWFVHFN